MAITMNRMAMEKAAARYMTVAQVAEQLGVSIYVVHRLLNSGSLGSEKVGWRRLIPRESVDGYVAELERLGQE